MRLVWQADIRPPTKKLVALAMADWCDDTGGDLYPSHAAIAGKVGVSRDQARRLVRELIADGLLAVISNAAGGAPGQTPDYRLNLDRLATMPRVTVTTQRQTRGIGTPPAECIDAPGEVLQTGCVDAQGTAVETGCTDALDGVHGRTGRGASMHETGCTDAPQTIIDPSENHKRGARAPRSKRCPPDFQVTDEMRAWARQKLPAGVDLDAATERFRDHEFQRAYTDWTATWRNWMRNERPPQMRGRLPQPQTAAGSAVDFAAGLRTPAPLPTDTEAREIHD